MLLKFNCRLPVQLDGASDQGTVPGFLDLSTGHFVSDPAAEEVKVPGSWDDWRTVAPPVLRGFAGLTYSRSAGRWLPAGWLQVAPDGLHYAYPEVPTPNVNLKLHVVDIAAGTDNVISTGPVWGILDYRSDGIYLTKTRYYSGESNSGIWRMDPLSGAVIQIVPETATTLFLSGGQAWGSDRPIMPTTLYRYDLATGTRSTWFSQPNRYVQYIASDGAGRPLVGVFTQGGPAELWLLSGPSQGSVIYSGSDGPWYGSAGPSDSHGTWMEGTGLWLFEPGGQLIRVTTAQIKPLGDCR